MKQERKMINLSAQGAIKAEELKLSVSSNIGVHVNWTQFFDLLYENREKIIRCTTRHNLAEH